MSAAGWLPVSVEDLFGPEATAEESYEVLTVDVPPAGWIAALRVARDELGCTYFDWLSAVDEPGTGLRVSAHVVALSPVRRLLVRTTVPHEAPVLPSAVEIYAGAAWHERETHEMFGVAFEGHPALDHLLLPDGFEGHPLRKDFVLAARVAKAWPGAKEPGESDHGGPKRRQMLPPGVPDPNEWGPLKGQLPPAPARPARAAGRATGERPVRRTRTTAEGSASQAPTGVESGEATPAPRRARSVSEGSASQRGAEPSTQPATAAGPRRARSASEGSTSQRAEGATGATAAPAGPRRARSVSEGSASQRAAESTEGAAPPAAPAGPSSGPRRSRNASEGSASQRADAGAAAGADPEPPIAPRSADAPWHHARPAFDEPEPTAPEPTAPEPSAEPEAGAVPPAAETVVEPTAKPGAGVKPPAKETAAEPSAEPEAGAVPPAAETVVEPTAAETVAEPPAKPDSPGTAADVTPTAEPKATDRESRSGDDQPPKPATPDDTLPDETTPDDSSGGTQ
ncbi:NADH-quinone oxidoreductase subunit C [Streptomyces sp. NPDC093261]|uniref:NADH-quinone oxidoreductase subunit C n=1 Tax=Streptomyces sp. NPDC093261 TaxID=3366037 RepID=UPI00380632EB